MNFDLVRELKQDAHGDYAVILENAPPLKVSRMFRSRIEERIHHRLSLRRRPVTVSVSPRWMPLQSTPNPAR